MQAGKSQILDTQLTSQVVSYIRAKIEDGALKPGDRIPPEREFAKELKISRASLRMGIGYLAAMGVMKVRHGVGTFVADGPAEFGKSSLGLMGALHGFKSWQMFEVRNLLETTLAALAAERGSEAHFTALAEEVAEMHATINDPAQYLIHDVLFHRTIAQASGNPILAALMETVSTALYEERRKTAERAKDRRMSMDAHREIYRAIRTGNPAEARNAMERHLRSAENEQATEQSVRGRRKKREQKTEATSA
jgi:GntR family transcriptional repressor for pyruvate dehydrogenase complex